MPLHVQNYTDFYSSIEHATNVGKCFVTCKCIAPELETFTVGYHGRASSIVVSGINFHRPKGQMKPADAENRFSVLQNN